MIKGTHIVRIHRQTPADDQHVRYRRDVQHRRDTQKKLQAQGPHQHGPHHHLNRVRTGKSRHRVTGVVHATQVARQQNIQGKRRSCRGNVEQNGQDATRKSLIAQDITQVLALLTAVSPKQRPMLTHDVRYRVVFIDLIIRGQREGPHLLQHVVVVTHHIGEGTARSGGNPRAGGRLHV